MSPVSVVGVKQTPAMARSAGRAGRWRYKISAHHKPLQWNQLRLLMCRISSPVRYKISPSINSLWLLGLSPRPLGQRYKRTSFSTPQN